MINQNIRLNSKAFTSLTICFVFTFIIPFSLISQIIQKDWDKTYGGDQSDFARILKRFPDGNYLICGGSGSGISGEKTQPNMGGNDYWILKIAPNGNLIWDKTYGGDNNDASFGLTTNNDGSSIIAGYYYVLPSGNINGDRTDFNRGYYDYWILKLDENGNKLWDKAYGSTGDEGISHILQINEGYLLLGHSSSNSGFDKSENNRGTSGRDAWVLKIDGNGQKIWDKTLGGSDDDRQGFGGYHNLWVLPDGSIFVAYSSRSPVSGERTAAIRGVDDWWLIKLDENGNKLWDKAYGGSGSDFLSAVRPTIDGNYLLAGYTNSGAEGDKTQPSQGNNDYWLIKIDSDGNILWDKSYGGSDDDRLTVMEPLQAGGYLLGGLSKSGISGDKSEANLGTYDFWIVKIDENGNKEWDKTFGGSGDDQMYSIIELGDKEFILAGHSNSNTGNDKSEDSRGSYDFWIIKTKPGDPFALQTLTLEAKSYTDYIRLNWTDANSNTTPYAVLRLRSQNPTIWDTLGFTSKNTFTDPHPRNGTNFYQICRVEQDASCLLSNIAQASFTQTANSGKEIFIYPNPFRDYLTIQYTFADSDITQLEILNALGQSLGMISLLSKEGKEEINTSEWAEGVYLIKMVRSGKEIFMQKIVLIRN